MFPMNNKQLEYALALSKSLSFSKTAEQLGISQPALSKQISGLERELGVELFDRHQNPLAVTAAGEYFFRQAKDLIYREEQLYKSMDSFKSESSGSLTIGVSPFRALYLLPEMCRKVKERFPGITVVLKEEASGKLRAKAAEGKYDFAIVNLPVDDSVLEARLIEQDTLVIAVPKNMASLIPSSKRFAGEIGFADCRELPFVVVSRSQEMRQLFERLCSVSTIRPTVSAEVVGLTTAWAMMRAGVGATILPLQFVKSMGDSEDFVLFRLKHNSDTRIPAVVTRRGQYLPEYAKYAIDILTGEEK